MSDAKLEHDATLKDQAATAESINSLDENISSALDDIKELESQAVDVKVRMSVLENAKNTDRDKNASILDEIAGYDKISADLDARVSAKQLTIDKYSADILSIDGEIGEISSSLAEAESERVILKQKLSDACFKRDSAVQRIDNYKAMEEHFEGYNGSVRFVMQKYAEGAITDASGVRCSKIYGPLSKVISVDDKYVTAIETALGVNLQNIVVADENAAKAAMFALKKAEALAAGPEDRRS